MNFKTWEHTVDIWNETIKMARWETVMPPEYVKGYKAGRERGKKEEHNRAVRYIKMLRSKDAEMTKEQTRKLMSALVEITMLYQQALKSDGILNPLAWAVYQVWKKVDIMEK